MPELAGDESEPRARDRLATLVDPRLMSALERRARERPVRELPPLRIYLREPELHVEPERWGAGYLAVRERELPAELFSDLKQRTPQASLRDLYRPVRESVWHEREPMVPDWDPGARRAFAEAHGAQKREPLPVIAPIAFEVKVEQARRRAFVAEPWKPHLDDSAPRPAVEVILR